jgi:hypothetical protein
VNSPEECPGYHNEKLSEENVTEILRFFANLILRR